MPFLVLLLSACSDDTRPTCTADERLVCVRLNDCRCGLRCTPSTTSTMARCPASDAGLNVCAPLAGSSGEGACVDLSWASGSPAGFMRCGGELCPVNAQCVNWGDAGIRCAPPCTLNSDCRSGCCSVVSDPQTRRTFNVCAPTADFRCMMGAPAGLLCQPPCASGEVCLSTPAGPRCSATCTGDTPGECKSSCCGVIMGGGRACAHVGTTCAAPLTPACGNLDACVTVTYASRGDHCGGSPHSVEVRIRNDCTRPADVKICFERRDGSCSCGFHGNVAPGSSPSPAFWACDLTGRFRVNARAAGDAPGCLPDQCQ